MVYSKAGNSGNSGQKLPFAPQWNIRQEDERDIANMASVGSRDGKGSKGQ